MANAARKTTLSPPGLVQIFYKPTDGHHRFTSPEVPGLLVFHGDLEVAFNMLASAISDLVSVETGTEVVYELDTDYATFERRVQDGPHLTEMFVPPLTAHPRVHVH